MKSLLKKATLSLFVFSSIAVAAGLITTEEVNKKVAGLLAPFNDETTAVSIQFEDLKVDSVRALDFGLNAMIAKKGPENKLILKLKNASYHYGNGSAPTVKGDLSLQLDLVKAMGQKALNGFSEALEEMTTNAVTELAKKYGPAVKLNIAVDELNKDCEGNFESAKMHLNATIDLNNLPENIKAEDVEIKSFKIRLAASTKGISARAQVVLNPQYKRFAANEPGLKEFIENLLNEDSGTYELIYEVATYVNKLANTLVTENNNKQ